MSAVEADKALNAFLTAYRDTGGDGNDMLKALQSIVRHIQNENDLERRLAQTREELAKVKGQARITDEVLDLLAVVFDAYEDGPDCYEDQDELSGHLGKAVLLDDDVFDRIADLLNAHRPREIEAEQVKEKKG